MASVLTRTRLHIIWRSMRLRCYCPSHKSYLLYGGRGITVCSEWKASWAPFRDWALANGYQEHLTLERKHNDLGYEPDNCCWATWREQERHRRNNIPPISAFGETKPIWDWLEDSRCKVSRNTLLMRLRTGRDSEWAMTMEGRQPARRKPHSDATKLKLSAQAKARWKKEAKAHGK